MNPPERRSSTPRKALVAEIVPALNGTARYTALMVANAMGIAAREIELGPQASGAHEAVLGRAPGEEDAPAEAGEAARAARLIQAIRAGEFDADAGLYRALWESTAVAAGMWKPALLAAAAKRPSNDRQVQGDKTTTRAADGDVAD